MVDNSGAIPPSDSPVEEKLLFLQENMVNFINQYNLPLVEVSLVLSKYIRILSTSLDSEAEKENEEIPSLLISQSPIEVDDEKPRIGSFPLDMILNNVDIDRMDIFDTIIRTIINSTELPFINAISLLRDWESITRIQLSKSTKPGHLFSPMELPENF
jgi:hypothetical protein|tara:strand:- start:216 stop:689 length:474 start_codon:yes stop_codon:yes gene_type:complete